MCLVSIVMCLYPLQVIMLCVLKCCKEYSNTISLFQAQNVIYDKKKKRATTQTSLDHFYKRIDRIESARKQNFCHQRQVWMKLQLDVHLLLLTILQLHHLPPPARDGIHEANEMTAASLKCLSSSLLNLSLLPWAFRSKILLSSKHKVLLVEFFNLFWRVRLLPSAASYETLNSPGLFSSHVI